MFIGKTAVVTLTLAASIVATSAIANPNFVLQWRIEVDPLGSAGKIDTATFSPDGSMLAIGDSQGTIRLYDRLDGSLLGTVVHDPVDRGASPGEDTGREVTAIAFSVGGDLLATGINIGGGLKVWRVADILAGRPSVLAHLHPDATTDFAVFSPDGRTLVSGANQDAVIYDARDFTYIARVENGDSGELNTIDFTEDGTLMALGAHINAVRLVSTADWSVFKDIPVSSKSVKSVRLSPTGAFVAVGQKDRKARIFDVVTGDLLADLPHGGRTEPLPGDDRGVALEAVEWSSDGRFVFTSGIVDGVLRAWNTSDWSLAASVPGQEKDRAIEYVDVSPATNGADYVVTAGDEGAAYLFLFKPD